MKFCKDISKEQQQALLVQLMDYEDNLQMTEEERKSLNDWVAEGHSTYDNASRFVDEQIRCFKNFTAGEQEKILKALKQNNISIDVFLQSM